MQHDATFGFSWEFLDEMTVWSLVVGLAIAIVGGFLFESVAFAVGCLVALAVDLGLVRIATNRGRAEVAGGRLDSIAPTVMLAGRLIAKACLLGAAVFVPKVLGFTGTIAGALTFDVTLVVAGSIVAVSRTMRHSGEGR